MPFYVINHDEDDGQPFLSVNHEHPDVPFEQFETSVGAQERAAELAKVNPGTVYEVVQTIALVSCKVPEPVVEMVAVS